MQKRLAFLLLAFSFSHITLPAQNLRTLDSLQTSIQKSFATKDSITAAKSEILLGEAYTKLGQLYLAYNFETKALDIGKKFKSIDLTTDAYKAIVEIFVKFGNYKMAYENEVLLKHLGDSIQSGLIQQKIAGLQSELSSARKEDSAKAEQIKLNDSLKLESARSESIAETDIQNRKSTRNLLLGCGALLILLIGLGVYLIRNSNQQKKVVKKEEDIPPVVPIEIPPVSVTKEPTPILEIKEASPVIETKETPPVVEVQEATPYLVSFNQSEFDQIDGSALKGFRILIADSSSFNRLVIKSLLQLKAFVQVDQAENGEKVLQQLEKHNYDVILLDVQLPGINGLEITRHIRNNFPTPKNDTPIIALTASVPSDDSTKFKQAGINDYIPIPFKPWQLFSAIAQQIVIAHNA